MYVCLHEYMCTMWLASHGRPDKSIPHGSLQLELQAFVNCQVECREQNLSHWQEHC